jgi:predicted nucleotidyltransferase component of viral defense system
VVKAFLSLSAQEKADVLNARAGAAGLPAAVLEKDVWICWLLKEVFEMPDRLPMVFKGGTSLSKVFRVIRRMSEDLDITIDTKSEFAELGADASNSQKKKRKEKVEEYVEKYIEEKITKRLKERCIAEFGEENLSFSIESSSKVKDKSKDKLRVEYPKVIESDEYLKDTVDLEFGGRNVLEPNDEHVIGTYLESNDLRLSFPKAKVNVLAVERTFWEKVTLLHAESNRKELRKDKGLFRHWYDVSKLFNSDFRERALNRQDLLESVVDAKKVLYYSVSANYDSCLKQQFKLIPDEVGKKILQEDLTQMISAGMFFEGENPVFDSIMSDISRLQELLNGSKNEQS